MELHKNLLKVQLFLEYPRDLLNGVYPLPALGLLLHFLLAAALEFFAHSGGAHDKRILVSKKDVELGVNVKLVELQRLFIVLGFDCSLFVIGGWIRRRFRPRVVLEDRGHLEVRVELLKGLEEVLVDDQEETRNTGNGGDQVDISDDLYL